MFFSICALGMNVSAHASENTISNNDEISQEPTKQQVIDEHQKALIKIKDDIKLFTNKIKNYEKEHTDKKDFISYVTFSKSEETLNNFEIHRLRGLIVTSQLTEDYEKKKKPITIESSFKEILKEYKLANELVVVFNQKQVEFSQNPMEKMLHNAAYQNSKKNLDMKIEDFSKSKDKKAVLEEYQKIINDENWTSILNRKEMAKVVSMEEMFTLILEVSLKKMYIDKYIGENK